MQGRGGHAVQVTRVLAARGVCNTWRHACRKGENIECKEEVVKQCRTVQKNVCKPEQKKVGLTCIPWLVVIVTRVPGVPH